MCPAQALPFWSGASLLNLALLVCVRHAAVATQGASSVTAHVARGGGAPAWPADPAPYPATGLSLEVRGRPAVTPSCLSETRVSERNGAFSFVHLNGVHTSQFC